MSKFRTRQGITIPDLREYVDLWVKDKSNVEIFVGCDSQQRGNQIDYVVSVCLYQKGKGGHIIDRRTSEKKTATHYPKRNKENAMDEENYVRLWKEVENAVKVADEIQDLGISITIHCDYNSVASEKSHRLHDAGIGFAIEKGYMAAGKPNAWAATYAADKMVKS